VILLKNDEVIDIYHDRIPIFQHSKMLRLQHQLNNNVKTTQLNNNQMPEYHCHCDVIDSNM